MCKSLNGVIFGLYNNRARGHWSLFGKANQRIVVTKHISENHQASVAELSKRMPQSSGSQVQFIEKTWCEPRWHSGNERVYEPFGRWFDKRSRQLHVSKDEPVIEPSLLNSYRYRQLSV